MNLIGLSNQIKLAVIAFWSAREVRERMLLSVAAVAAAIGLFYALLINPALTGRDQLNRNLPILRQQAAQMQAMAKEAYEFSEKLAMPAAIMTEESIRTELSRNGLKLQSVTLNGDQARVQLAAASFVSMLEWLDDMQKAARFSVIDANIAALDQPDIINATLTLRQN